MHTRRLLCLLAMLLVSLPLGAADKPQANTLTPKEIADGWLLLFDGETTFGWSTADPAKWTIADGMIAPQADNTGPLVTSTAFSEYELSLEYQVKKDSKAHVLIGCDRIGKQAQGAGSVELPYKASWALLTAKVKGPLVLTHSIQSTGASSFNTVGAAIGGKDVPPASAGHIALSGSGMVFRNIKLKPLGLQSIFNGKDLTGWKEHPGKKSKWSVNDKGWIDLKDGPGDLQTESQWDDFVLQIECISNGKNLNSGVFFRCLPGLYQQGYEAQIHNGFLPEGTKEYTIEEYDPETNKLTGTKKVKYAAIDYGTGAIYRRIPARKQAAKDNEWFTMTVAAQGRHIATWVNGYQVVDWTDNRPVKDNARNGCKLEKGNVSLQGHDPTTDLSFRNIRITELAK